MSATRLVLPLPARALWPNARPHWATKATAVKEARYNAWMVAKSVMGRGEPPRWMEAETRAVFYFANARTRDRDNAAASLKAYWDGIADAGVIANDAGFVHWPAELRIDRSNPRVELTVTPLSTETP